MANMKIARTVLFLSIGLLSVTSLARADKLDDMIAALRVGAQFDASKLGMNLLTELKDMPGSPSKAFNEAVADLYLYEIKLSIIDPASEGGWPYRSFLIQTDLNLRDALTKTLKARFGQVPTPIVAYAMICPALYAKDDQLVGRLESYLKEHDPYLYKCEQSNVTQDWRPNIESNLKSQAGGN